MGKSFNDIKRGAEVAGTKVLRNTGRESQQILREYKRMGAEFAEGVVKPTEEVWFDDSPPPIKNLLDKLW